MINSQMYVIGGLPLKADLIEYHHWNTMRKSFTALVQEMRTCRLCEKHLEPNPVFQLSRKASILIAGQAPGIKVHESGIPFTDPSGDRLRDWMGVSKDIFYNANKIAILPMGFCYPGKGKSGDLPPRKECALAWRDDIIMAMPNIQLTLVIGSYAMDWHLGRTRKQNLTDTVKAWQSYTPGIIPLPHPSPRNNIWLSKNRWFEDDVVPCLQKRK